MGLGVSRELFAPTIRYHNGVFYIIFTLVDKGGNFIIYTKDPFNSWSNPVWIPEVKGIDPSLYFDRDDKTYILYNSNPANQISEYDGHRTIKIIEFDLKTLKAKGESQILINKGAKPKDNPIWIEGPHLFNKNDYYYLIAAEGGTGYEHSEVVFRSTKLKGPYESYSNNPILTQRHLNKNRSKLITSIGHADFVEDKRRIGGLYF